MSILGIDIGASRLKSFCINPQTHYSCQSSAPIETLRPEKNWAEQDPYSWLEALQKTMKQLYQENPDEIKNIQRLSITAGAHIMVLCDKTGQALRHAILWSDLRATDCAKQLYNMAGDDIINISFHTPNATWPLAQLDWIRQYEPHIWKRIDKILPAKDWVRFQITKSETKGERGGTKDEIKSETMNIKNTHPIDRIKTDISDAVGTGLFDIQNKRWSKTIAEKISLDVQKLPLIGESHEENGQISQQASKRFFIAQGATCVIGAIDTTAEWLCLGHEQASIKLASAGVVSFLCPTPKPIPPVSCYPQAIKGWYFASGMNACLGALHWARKKFLNDMTLDDMEKLAKTAPAGAQGVLFYPYLYGERAPLWDDTLTPKLTGQTSKTTKAHIARAIYEGIGFALYHIRQDMQMRCHIKPESFGLLGGGAQSDFWAQIIASQQNCPVIRPPQTQAAYGAARLASIKQTGRPAIEQNPKAQKMFQPNMKDHLVYQKLFSRFKRQA